MKVDTGSLEISTNYETFVLWNFRSHSQRNVVSLSNTNYDYLIDKLMVLKRYSLFFFCTASL